jgi:hypothetical protein
VVYVTETDTALYLNNVNLDNVILNDTETFVDSAGLVDVTETDTGLCLSSVSFPSIIRRWYSYFSVGWMASYTQ